MQFKPELFKGQVYLFFEKKHIYFKYFKDLLFLAEIRVFINDLYVLNVFGWFLDYTYFLILLGADVALNANTRGT